MDSALPAGHALAAFARRLVPPSGDGHGPTIGIRPQLDFVNLRGSADDEAFIAAASAVLDQPLPVAPNSVTRGTDTVYWLGPNEWLIETASTHGTALAGRLRDGLADVFAAVTVLNGGMVSFRLRGKRVRTLLAKGTTLDLDSGRFVSGDCAQSGLAKAAVLIAAVDDAPVFDVLVRRSFADYLAIWFDKAGNEIGARFSLSD